jgi:hypothetical protein
VVDPVELVLADVPVISAASSRADCRSWLKGFSTITRAFLVGPAPDSALMVIPNRLGGISR